MSYWKCIDAKILDDGRLVEMSFKDDHSRSQRTITLDAKTWSDIMIFQSNAQEPERRWRQMQDQLAFDLYRTIKDKIKGEKE